MGSCAHGQFAFLIVPLRRLAPLPLFLLLFLLLLIRVLLFLLLRILRSAGTAQLRQLLAQLAPAAETTLAVQAATQLAQHRVLRCSRRRWWWRSRCSWCLAPLLVALQPLALTPPQLTGPQLLVLLAFSAFSASSAPPLLLRLLFHLLLFPS